MLTPAYMNFGILLLISAIHIYWTFGGEWGLSASLPHQDGRRLLNPKQIDILTVAVFMAAMACFYLYKIGWFALADLWMPNWLSRYGLWMLAGGFLLRAIGDFRYVGFFKQVRNSRFAELDTKFYSPLCLLLSLNTLLLIVLQ